MTKTTNFICAAAMLSAILLICSGFIYFKNRLDLIGNEVALAVRSAPSAPPLHNVDANLSEIVFDDEIPRGVADLLRSRTLQELETKRHQLIDYIWEGRGFPGGAGLEPDVLEVHSFGGHEAFRLSVDVGSAGTSTPIFVRSHGPSDCLFLYHSGHDEGSSPPLADALELMQLALSSGCDLIHSSMPNDGDNKQVDGFDDHNQMGAQETESFTPIRWFLDPAVRSIDWALSKQNYDKVIVAGRSGGGWTAGLLGALDHRIDATVVVNGSMPFHVKGRRVKDVGDWEQTHSRIYDLVDYGDLYLLSALEEGRSAYYSWNKYDPCCFAGARARVFFPLLQHQADDWGISGLEYHVEDDPRAGHSITPSSLGAVAALILSHQRML